MPSNMLMAPPPPLIRVGHARPPLRHTPPLYFPPPACANLCSTCEFPSPRGGPSRSSTRSACQSTTAPSPVAPTPGLFAPSGFFKLVRRSWSPSWNWMTSLPRCCPTPSGSHGPSPHGSSTSSPGGLGEVDQPLLPIDVHGPGGCLPCGLVCLSCIYLSISAVPIPVRGRPRGFRTIALIAATRAAKALLQPPGTRHTSEASSHRPHAATVACDERRIGPPQPLAARRALFRGPGRAGLLN